MKFKTFEFAAALRLRRRRTRRKRRTKLQQRRLRASTTGLPPPHVRLPGLPPTTQPPLQARGMGRPGGETASGAAEAAHLQLYQQQAAHWKARAVAAQYENKILRHLLDQQFKLTGSQLFQLPASFKQPTPKRIPTATKSKNIQYGEATIQSAASKPLIAPVLGCSGDNHYDEVTEGHHEELDEGDCDYEDIDDDEEIVGEDEEESDSESIEFEMSGEFKHFLEVNRKHKEELAKERERLRGERGSESESEVTKRMERPPTDEHGLLRERQLRLLYGEQWRRVEGLETYVRMKYDQFCDSNRPEYWPNIPLKL